MARVRREGLGARGRPIPRLGVARGLLLGCFPDSGATPPCSLAEGERREVYQDTVWSNLKAGADPASAGSRPRLVSNGASHSGGPSAGETGGGRAPGPD